MGKTSSSLATTTRRQIRKQSIILEAWGGNDVVNRIRNTMDLIRLTQKPIELRIANDAGRGWWHWLWLNPAVLRVGVGALLSIDGNLIDDYYRITATVDLKRVDERRRNDHTRKRFG